jgi:nucleotide-binding universal stress UspA family protein
MSKHSGGDPAHCDPIQWVTRMIKTILVPATGTDLDAVVFPTALAAARLFQAHLEFCHIKTNPGDAMRFLPHAQFAMGEALRNVLDDWRRKMERSSQAAASRVREFCTREQIVMADAPLSFDVVSARWSEEDGPAEESLVRLARHNDLVVMGRSTTADGSPPDLARSLLLGCGRPILIPSARAAQRLTGTVMVCWKDAKEPARAVTAAMPFLAKADRVIVVAVKENGAAHKGGEDLVRHMAWHRINAVHQAISANGRPTGSVLASAAQDCRADLLVMGGYGRGPLREDIFGGCTRSFLENAALPVLVLH